MYFINESGDTCYEICDHSVKEKLLLLLIPYTYTHNSAEDTTIHIVTKLLRRNE